MAVEMGPNRYGKEAVRLVRVVRDGMRHEVRDLTVRVLLEGTFDESFTAGDNRRVVPTDTMKNVVYAFVGEEPPGPPEEFGRRVAAHFCAEHAQVSRAVVDVVERPWRRILVAGEPSDHAFTPAGTTRRIAQVAVAASTTEIHAGIDGLELFKTTGSEFERFSRDAHTTLADASDRLLASTLDATWRYGPEPPADFDAAWERVRGALVERFADHYSKSVQDSLYAMGGAALEAEPAVAEITLRMPNQHHLPVDLAPFGLTNRDEVFQPVGEPRGLIEGTVRRA